jgi:hypothetical protein
MVLGPFRLFGQGFMNVLDIGTRTRKDGSPV